MAWYQIVFNYLIPVVIGVIVGRWSLRRETRRSLTSFLFWLQDEKGALREGFGINPLAESYQEYLRKSL